MNYGRPVITPSMMTLGLCILPGWEKIVFFLFFVHHTFEWKSLCITTFPLKCFNMEMVLKSRHRGRLMDFICTTLVDATTWCLSHKCGQIWVFASQGRHKTNPDGIQHWTVYLESIFACQTWPWSVKRLHTAAPKAQNLVKIAIFRAQNLPGPAPNSVLTVLQILSKSVHYCVPHFTHIGIVVGRCASFAVTPRWIVSILRCC